MQQKKAASLLVVLVASTAIFWQIACKREQIIPSDPVCFETQLQPLLTSNCSQPSCHNASNMANGRDYTTYQGILKDVKAGDHAASKLFEVLIKPRSSGEAMPPKPFEKMPSDQIELVALWIEQGAVETKNCVSSTVCDTASVTFSGSVKPILATYCNGCHAGSSPSSGINYSSYTGVKKSADDGGLVGSVDWSGNFSEMPKNGNQLSACQIATIRKWVAEGALNN